MRNLSGSFKINGVSIPTPTSYEYSIEDLSSEATGRTMDGTMHKDVVAVKDYYTCGWDHLSWEDTAVLMNAINGKTRVTFTYLDPRIPGTWSTGNFYVGQRGGAALDLKQTGRQNWSGIKFQFTRI